MTPSPPSTAGPAAGSPVPDLSAVLHRLGLAAYEAVLAENGFRTWETVLDITEEDLTALRFKLGHRRALQREIATYRGIPPDLALDIESPNTADQKPPAASPIESLVRQNTSPPPREKRRYRRHPRPDPNAPKKPKTAYVNFADDLRTSPEISALSFVDIAREVGRRWQELPAEKKRVWESNAARAMHEYEVQMDEYKKTSEWRKYQAYLVDFKAQQAAAQSGKRTGSTRPDTYVRNASRASPSPSSESPLSNPSSASAGTEAEQCHNALTLAFSESVSLRGEILGQGVRPYEQYHLPPEPLIRRAMRAFVQNTGSLLYMWTYWEIDQILECIYRPQKPVDGMTLAECFTIAAMGAHYDSECFPDQIRHVLYASGTLFFNEKTARLDHMRTMRLLLSMAYYALLEKHMSARHLIAAGLQIARWKYPALMNAHPETLGESWRRIYRSLIFMDCWLSYTLGYPSEVNETDVMTACVSKSPEMVSIDEQIHMQTSRVCLVAAEVSKTVASPDLATPENIAMMARKLEDWRRNVPFMLQLAALTSDHPTDLTLDQRRAMLMVHILHLGALILLYRHLLVATGNQPTDGETWSLDVPVEDVRRYRNECALAGLQIARIMQLISLATKRCWITIYWSFTASLVLLFSAACKLLEGVPASVEQDLDYSKRCIDVLDACRSSEPIAASYLDMLWPLYDALRDKHQRMVGRAKTSIFSLLQADPNLLSPPIPVSKTEMAPISEKLSALLTDPFGRRSDAHRNRSGRRVLNDDGSYSVFWWK